MSLVRFHPSRLGLIMTDAKAIDPALLVGEYLEISKKKVKTDEDKAILEPLWDMTLSQGAKTELKSIAKEEIFGYRKNISSRYLDKGLMCEDACIELRNLVLFDDLKKNTERRSNEWLTGELDLIKPSEKRIIDIKCAWDMDTFPAFAEDVADKNYEYQGRAYLMLWDMEVFELCYCLVDTPEELIKWDQPELHRVSHIPPEHRISRIEYRRDLAIEEKIKRKCDAAQKYVLTLFEQFEKEHSL